MKREREDDETKDQPSKKVKWAPDVKRQAKLNANEKADDEYDNLLKIVFILDNASTVHICGEINAFTCFEEKPSRLMWYIKGTKVECENGTAKFAGKILTMVNFGQWKCNVSMIQMRL